MVMEQFGKDELNIIFSSSSSPKHVLHLYSPRINKYRTFRSFFSDETTAYVTAEDLSSVSKQFRSKDNMTVIHPHQMHETRNYKQVLVDAGSIEQLSSKTMRTQRRDMTRPRKKIGFTVLENEYTNMFKRETHLNKFSKGKAILCAYDISKLNSTTLKKLVKLHDKVILSSPVEALEADCSFSVEDLNSKKIQQFVKNELESIVLALSMRGSICGQDVKESVYKKFNILLSSGTLYPLLHKLEKQGLLQAKSGFKTKLYFPIDEKKIVSMLEEHVQVKNFLNGFLKATMNGGKIEKIK